MDSLILCYTAIIIILSLVIHHRGIIAASTSPTPTQLRNGFSATPSNTGSDFQPLLTDSTGSAFAFGFMHVGPTRLDLAVIHLPSSVPVWRAMPSSPVNWSPTTKLSFINGDLVLTDTTIQNDPIWSTTSSSSSGKGDFVILTNTSNLEIRAAGDDEGGLLPVWQSFEHPFDTLVQGQNFTALTPLFTADKRYSFRIGKGYIALYMMFNGSRKKEINYWRHGAVEAVNNSQLYGVIDPLGFFYLHNADGSKAEQIPFNSFNRGLVGLHRITLQSDGNLYAYYWDGKEWVLDYTAVSERCGLPGTCGAYGLCVPGESTCSCLVNGTDGCLQSTDSGDFCGGDGTNSDDYSVVRRAGVTVEYTDLMVSVPAESLDDCESTCGRNCTCWGALYVNVSGNCYLMDSPIQTVEASGNSYRGYFKVWNGNYNGGNGGRGGEKGHGVMVGLLVSFSVVFVAVAAYGAYVFWDRRRNKMPRVQLGGSSTQEMT